MKAAVLHAADEPMQMEEVRLADPGPGEVLVRVQAAGICHSDLHYMTGDLTCRLPVVLGHEGTGVVEAAGDGVRGVQPGDAVVLMWRPRCGQCEFCLDGRPALCAAIKVPTATGGLLDLYEAGRLPLDRLLGTEYRLDDINAAFARLPTESVGRGVIVFEEPS
jgi:Zn-dependent alcohol dehydrogenase